jgi:hypothetical protein
MKFFNSFSLSPWKNRREARWQRESESLRLGVAAQLRVLESQEHKADAYWLRKKQAPPTL